MAVETTAVGRATAELTGSDTVDYAADLDMRDTLDGTVCVEIALTKGSLDEITVNFHGGGSASPTAALYMPGAVTSVISGGNGTVVGGMAPVTDVFSGTTDTRVYVVRAPGCRYFRASVTGGGTPTSSDAVITYRYLSYQTLADTDGGSRLS